MSLVNQQVLLKSRPRGEVTPDNFEFREVPVGQPGPGQVLCRTIYLSLDPYMRGRMNAGRSYVEPVKVGAVMCGGTVSQVVQSNDPRFAPGDYVLGYDGWQSYGISRADDLRKLDPAAAPRLSYYLGALGMPGMTAYFGLLDIGQPKAGETVLVSSAAGAVGSVAGQIAKLKGCRVVGAAGSDAKCDYIVKELGFDAAVNYKGEDPLMAVRAACPDGVDVYVDNVGGMMLETALKFANLHGRIVVIGMISQYNATALPPGPNLVAVLIKRLKIQGMIVSDYRDRAVEFERDMHDWIRSGKVKVREHIVSGLTNAPQAFIGLFRGENFGKLIVEVTPDLSPLPAR